MYDLGDKSKERIEMVVNKIKQMDDYSLSLLNRDADTLLAYENVKKLEENQVG